MKNKQVLLIGAVFVAGCTLSLAIWLLTPGWVPLLPGQNSEGMRASVMNHLVASGENYKLEDSTQQILVRSDRVSSIRSELALHGLPVQDQRGFELFDESEYGMSEFMQNINYQRALEVELSRTIRALHGIRTARVHLTLEKESLFQERQKTAKASVVLEPSENNVLGPAEIYGVKEIVATSVAGLEVDAVSVIDIYGVPMSSGSTELLDVGSRTGKLEAALRKKVESLLLGMFPDMEVRIGVNVELDLTKKKKLEETIIPKNRAGDGFIVKSRSVAAGEAVAGSSARPASNGPNTEEIEYTYSTEKTETTYSSGTIKRLGVGVVLIGAPIDETLLAKVETLIGATIGMEAARGDSVNVISHTQGQVLELEANPDHNVSGSSPDMENTGQKENVLAPTSERSADDSTTLSHIKRHLSYEVAVYLMIALAILALGLAVTLFARHLKSRNRSSSLTEDEKRRVVQEFRAWVEQ